MIRFLKPHDKEQFVKNVFASVASKYDLMNDIMSGFTHRLWKDQFIRKMNPLPGTELLDVAGGTGDISFRFLDFTRNRGDLKSTATICDLSREMIEEGKKKSQALQAADKARLSWVHGDALELPFENEQFDVYSIAYGIRNVTSIEQCLAEAHRVLRPGGMFICLEFSRMRNPLMVQPYERYLLDVLPVIGEVVVGDFKSYKYLGESILKFPDQEDFKDMIFGIGFKQVKYENIFQGISAIHWAFKS